LFLQQSQVLNKNPYKSKTYKGVKVG